MAGVRQALRITKESVYGTYDSGASAGNKAIIILPKDNPFNGAMKPRIWRLMSAGQDGRQIRQGSKQKEAMCGFDTFLFPSQAALILGLAGTITAGACRSISSCTIDFGYHLDDDSCTFAGERYLGCVMDSFAMGINANGDGVMCTANCSFKAQKREDATIVDFPEPANADYPDEDPFLFQDSVGALKIGTTQSDYFSILFSNQNTLTQRFDENQYARKVRWRSRKSTLAVGLLYKSNTLRDASENQTALDTEFTLTNTAGDILKVDLNARNYVEPFGRTFPIQGDFEQTATLNNCVDPATGTDWSFTYTPHP